MRQQNKGLLKILVRAQHLAAGAKSFLDPAELEALQHNPMRIAEAELHRMGLDYIIVSAPL